MVEEKNFKENVKLSFKKAREHMDSIENSLISLKKEIVEIKALLTPKSSTGNEGVLSKRASEQAIKQALFKHSEVIKGFNEDLETHFKSLSKQEFLVFLSLYQLEEEIGPVRFIDLAHHLNLSEGCIRAYIYKLLTKGTPIIKKKVNNRIVHLSLSPDFRSLNLKKRLTDIYYQSDTSQKRLFDSF